MQVVDTSCESAMSSSKHPSVRFLKNLPKYPTPKRSHERVKLIVQGDVEQPLKLSLKELRSFPTIKLSEDFRCLEGWTVKDVLWEGIPIPYITQATGAKKSSKFLLFRAGKYTYTMKMKTALENNAILALKQSGKWLTSTHGGPVRLVFNRHDCYEGVKWVDRIELLTKQAEDTAERIALSRIRT